MNVPSRVAKRNCRKRKDRKKTEGKERKKELTLEMRCSDGVSRGRCQFSSVSVQLRRPGPGIKKNQEITGNNNIVKNTSILQKKKISSRP